MAEFLNITEVRNYPTGKGETADLVSLISANCPQNWVQAAGPVALGTVAYVYAMGELRRGVVVKLTKTKTFVAFTTQGAVDEAGRYRGGEGIRVQTTAAPHECIRIAPPADVAPEDSAAAEAQVQTWFSRHNSLGTDIARGAYALIAYRLADHEDALAEDARRTAATIVEIVTEVEATEALTLHSQDGKVDSNSTDDLEETEMTAFPNDNREPAEGEQAMNATPAEPENHTGSTVVKVLEKVWSRIRSNHPELPEVVIITGSGEGTKWGHFRAESWKVRAEEGAAVSGEPGRRHELFLASEALAKGPTQVLQTMIHEAAHTISRVRGIKDTSRQGRWHNAEFKKAAAELGLEHKSSTADKSHGFSFVTLTQATKDRYADLIAELETEIKLTGLLPLWMGGSDQEDERGGERITGKPTKGGEAGGAKSGPMKATCACAEPVIIRLSQKVLDMGVVRCDGCETLFTAA